MAIRTDVTVDWVSSPRLITVAAPSVSISVQDVVDTCRAFEDSTPNEIYEFLIDAAGKEPLGGTVFVGITATLNNAQIAFEARLGPDWILCTIDGGNLVAIDDVGDILDVRQPTAFTSVNLTAASSATLQEQAAIQYSSYNGGVWVSTAGTSGVTYPTGTPAEPVDNLADAHIIMTTNGFTKMNFLTDWTFPNGTVMAEHEIIGQGPQKTIFTFELGSILNNCEAYDAQVTGVVDGITGFDGCLIKNLSSVGLAPSSVSVYAKNCFFEGTVALPSNYSGIMTAVDCWALPDINGDPPVIDAGDSTAQLQIRNWSGLLEFKNITNPVDVRIFLASGGVILDSSVTAGDFLIYGVGTLEDNSTSVTALDVDGLMSKETVSQAVWDEPIADHLIEDTMGHQVYTDSYQGQVVVDVVGGSPGITYPIGTHENPVNNLTDALTIAIANNFHTIHVEGVLTINGENVEGYTFISERSLGNSVVITSMVNAGYCYFEDLTVFGALSGGSRFTTCVLGALTGFDGGAKNCLITDDIVITGGGANYFTECDTYVVSDTYKEISVGSNLLNIIKCRGSFGITDYTGSSVVAIDLVAGQCRIASSCVSGTIVVSGLTHLTDESAVGCTVIDASLTQAGTADAVWDETLADHMTVGSMGVAIAQTLGLLHSNIYIDDPTYDKYGNMISARVRTYSDAASVGTNNNIIETYRITSDGTECGQFDFWKQVVGP